LREASLTSKILNYLNSLPGCKAEKRHGSQYSEAGAPDINACYKGRSIQIEAKQPGKKPTPIQLKRLQEWQEAGAVVGWVTDLEGVKRMLEELE
jgi:hypothetical protein